MERVAFFVERPDGVGGAPFFCLLNPESLVRRRTAGLRPRAGATGAVTGHGLSDDPLVATGGGVTEIELDLLFDTAVAGEFAAATEAPPAETDVRDLTRPFWDLAENAAAAEGYGAPPTVRLIWGRAWNIRGVVTAAAERLEHFLPSGAPQRSWLRLRLRRVPEEVGAASAAAAAAAEEGGVAPVPLLAPASDAPSAELPVGPDGLPLQRLDQVAADRYGDPTLWRLIAELNGIEDPLAPGEGTVLRLPDLPPAAPPGAGP